MAFFDIIVFESTLKMSHFVCISMTVLPRWLYFGYYSAVGMTTRLVMIYSDRAIEEGLTFFFEVDPS